MLIVISLEQVNIKLRAVYREPPCLQPLLVLLSTELRLSHLLGMPYEDILSFVKGLDWPQLYYYAYVCWKIPGKVRRNHMGFWLESNEISLECKSKENLSSERNFTTIKISILLQNFSFFECPIICTYSGILFYNKDLGVAKHNLCYMRSSSFESRYCIISIFYIT